MTCKKLNGDQFKFYCWIFCVITSLTLSGLVIWISLTPHNPRFRISIEEFVVQDKDDLSPSRGNISLSNRSLILDVEFSNPNKRMGIYYEVIELEFLTGGGRNCSPGFYQGFRNVTVVKTPIQGSEEFWEGVDNNFTIRVETDVRFRIMKWKTKVHHIAYERQLLLSSLNGTFV